MRRRMRRGLVAAGLLGAGWATIRRLGAFRVEVAGDSMSPTLEAGQYLVATRPPARLGRGDVVVVRRPERPIDVVKRVVGLPGEEVVVEDGVVTVGGRRLDEPYARGTGPGGRWHLGPDEFVVLGDNRDRSSDSRAFGAIPRGAVVGVVRLRYWPRAGWLG